MTTINRLLIRETMRIWRQAMAICLLLACGVATHVMSTSAVRSLDASLQRYYNQFRFGDVFAQLVRAPNEVASRLRAVEGVEQLQSRIVRDVLLDVPAMIEPASCRLVSIERDPGRELNGLYLRRGRFPVDYGRVEVVVSELFAEAHRLQPGDELTAIMGGRRQKLEIVGIGLSPEFVYSVQPGLLLTDSRRFGAVWMPRRQMAAAFNMEGAFNNLSVTLRPGASIQHVIDSIDQITLKYGGTGAYGRKDQDSHHRVADEMEQMRSMANVTPSIFLAVSAFLFNIVFTRMVKQQSEQIAMLRAFGYTSIEIGSFYSKMVLMLVATGSLVGWCVGIRMSWWMNDFYGFYFRFPSIQHSTAAGDVILAVVLATVGASLGVFSAIRHAMRLPPAVAMRSESPQPHRVFLAERLGLASYLSPLSRMVVRRFETNRRASSLSILGMSMAMAVLVLGSFMENTIDFVVDHQFDRSQRQDVMLTFRENMSASAAYDVCHLPGVKKCEPFRAVPVRLRWDQRYYRTSLLGMDESPNLFRILNDRQQAVPLPTGSGLTLSKKLAEILEVRLGDEVIVEVLEGQRSVHSISVTHIFPNFTGPCAYMNRATLHKLLGESEQLSGVYLSVEMALIEQLYQKVKGLPTIAGVLDKHAALRSFRETVSNVTAVMRSVNAVFASLIAMGVIFNCAMITLAEQARDLATLRVMGFTRREVSLVLVAELAIISFIAIPLGVPIGYAFAYVTTLALDTETHRFPLIIYRVTFANAAVIILISAFVSSLFVRRMTDRLDLLAVLKVRE